MSKYTHLAIRKNSTALKMFNQISTKKKVEKNELLEKILKIGIYEILKQKEMEG